MEFPKPPTHLADGRCEGYNSSKWAARTLWPMHHSPQSVLAVAVGFAVAACLHLGSWELRVMFRIVGLGVMIGGGDDGDS